MIPFEAHPQKISPSLDQDEVLIVGIGGAGTNILNRIFADKITSAPLLIITGDSRAISKNRSLEHLQLGSSLVHGLGTGGDPELGTELALQSQVDIKEKFQDRKLIFLCAGLGGGTGSGATPQVAEFAKNTGSFVVAFVTLPFSFEGGRRRTQAETALAALRQQADILIVFENDMMLKMVSDGGGVHKTFEEADLLLANSIRAIENLVKKPGLIRIGIDDLKTALSSHDSRCLFGFGESKLKRGSSQNQVATRDEIQARGIEAMEKALSSPLLGGEEALTTIKNAIVHIAGGPDLTISEIQEIMDAMLQKLPENTHLLFGTSVEASLEGSVQITLISSLPGKSSPLPEPVSTTEESVEPPNPEISSEEDTPEIETEVPEEAAIESVLSRESEASKEKAPEAHMVEENEASDVDTTPLAQAEAPVTENETAAFLPVSETKTEETLTDSPESTAIEPESESSNLENAESTPQILEPKFVVSVSDVPSASQEDFLATETSRTPFSLESLKQKPAPAPPSEASVFKVADLDEEPQTDSQDNGNSDFLEVNEATSDESKEHAKSTYYEQIAHLSELFIPPPPSLPAEGGEHLASQSREKAIEISLSNTPSALNSDSAPTFQIDATPKAEEVKPLLVNQFWNAHQEASPSSVSNEVPPHGVEEKETPPSYPESLTTAHGSPETAHRHLEITFNPPQAAVPPRPLVPEVSPPAPPPIAEIPTPPPAPPIPSPPPAPAFESVSPVREPQTHVPPQPSLDIETEGKGKFEHTTRTIVDGEDLDVPTWKRLGKRSEPNHF